MKSQHIIGSALLSLAFAAAPLHAGDSGADAKAKMKGTDGEQVGHVAISEGPEGVVLRVEMDGLPAGWKAIHIHGTGTCADNEEGFTASGGHVDPTDREHGLLNPEGPEAGDLPNIWVHEDGEVRAEIFASGVSLSGDEAALLDEDGAALVVHEGADDHVSQPIGGAGARIACGVVEAD